jgi:hypothetical protein
VATSAPDAIAAEALIALENAPQVSKKMRSLIDIEQGWPDMRDTLNDAASYSLTRHDSDLAKIMNNIFENATDQFSAGQEAACHLDDKDRAVYEKLTSE